MLTSSLRSSSNLFRLTLDALDSHLAHFHTSEVRDSGPAPIWSKEKTHKGLYFSWF